MFLIQSIRLKNLPYSKLELIFSLRKNKPKGFRTYGLSEFLF